MNQWIGKLIYTGFHIDYNYSSDFIFMDGIRLEKDNLNDFCLLWLNSKMVFFFWKIMAINKSQNNILNYEIVKCKNFDKDGTCKYGAHCTFAHGEKYLRNKYENLYSMNNPIMMMRMAAPYIMEGAMPIMMPPPGMDMNQMQLMMASPGNMGQNSYMMMMPQPMDINANNDGG